MATGKPRTAANPKSKIQNPKSRRRGIVLLIVVSLLALFILMGVAFMIVALNYKSAAEGSAKPDQVGDPPEREMELVLDQIIFDTNGRSSLRGHSFLADLYGHDSVVGLLIPDPTVANPPGPHAINMDSPPGLDLTATPQQQPQAWQFAATGSFHQSPGYYAGRVITFRTGNCAGHSTRVLESAYDPATGISRFAIEALESKGPTNLRPNVGSNFLINGAPFNGVGAGYSVSGADMSATYAGRDYAQPQGNYLPTSTPIAFSPHFAGYDPQPNGGAMSDAYDAGGLDETWDAVDFQNMYLAMYPPIAAATPGTPIIPSYHRPELVNFWANNLPVEFTASAPPNAFGSDPHLRNFLRTFIFRPMPWDHPNFNGSNPAFDFQNIYQPLINGGMSVAQAQEQTTATLIANLINSGNAPIWDVDNDNDGVPDSIWIDPGLPVVTSPDGRRYKRLVSILIKDMDGRINLNAHGNLSQIPPSSLDGVGPPNVGTGSDEHRADTPIGPSLGMASAGATLPRGMGFGPGEVSFLHVFGGDAAAYGAILTGRYASNVVNPGPDGTLGTSDDIYDQFSDADGDGLIDARPGYPLLREDFSFVKHHGVPNDYVALGAPFFSWYASPPDVWGRGAIALDYGGHPITNYMGQPGEMIDTPYELSLSGQPSNSDRPYTLVELERMLRYHDQDTQGLASRPLLFARSSSGTYYLASDTQGAVGISHALRELFTTHSSHLSVPAYHVPLELRTTAYFAGEPYSDTNMNGRYDTGEMYTDSVPNGVYDGPKTSTTLLDLYRARLISAGISAEPHLSNALRAMVPWELMHGQRFDINRWLGDGFDGNGDGAADDPVEATVETVWQAPGSFTGVPAQHTNSTDMSGNGIADALDNFSARQLYARHLYCMAMLAIPTAFNPEIPQETTLLDPQEVMLTARRVAQWAINCAEFRDSDSIMTPFEFDLNPFGDDDSNPANGTWDVDGNIRSLPGADGNPGTLDDIPAPEDLVSYRGLVWGMEYPDLLVSETVCFHDRRVKDTDKAGPTDKKRQHPSMPPAIMIDEDLDQLRVPEGSLFVELYCPRNNYSRNPRLPMELYWDDTDPMTPPNPRLDLTKRAPLTPGSGEHPVWRLALSRITKGDDESDVTSNGAKQPFNMASTFPESASFDPTSVNLLPLGTPGVPNGVLPIERYVWFTSPAATGLAAPLTNNVFYNTNTSGVTPLVQPGQYAVVGPRPRTRLGSLDTENPPATGLWAGNSPQRIEIGPNGWTVFTTGGGNASPPVGTVRPAIPIIAHMENVRPISQELLAGPGAWSIDWTIGLNITEPLPFPTLILPSATPTTPNYYPEPTVTPISAAGTNQDGPQARRSFYDDPELPTVPPDGSGFRDRPVESSDRVAPYPAGNGRPIRDYNMQPTGTYTEVSSVFVQRLANPVAPYNPPPGTDPYVAYNSSLPPNPYISIDWAGIDATVFTGEEDTNKTTGTGVGMPAGGAAIDPDDQPADRPGAGMNQGVPRGTRQRGYPQTGAPDSNFWNPITDDPEYLADGVVGPYFGWDYSAAAPPPAIPPHRGQTLGYVNSTVGAPDATYIGEPMLAGGQTCPWLAWHNRPFTNPMELLTVPSSAPGRVCSEIVPGPLQGNGNVLATSDDIYDATDATDGAKTFRSPFGTLLNFFQTADQGASPTVAAQLVRLLDHVEVPSPYLGAERWYNPDHFAAAGTYRPPFNKMSRFRDPGVINFNTIFDDRIWDAAIAQFPGLTDADGKWGQVALSRQGFGTRMLGLTDGPDDTSGTAYPTRFANPLRSANASDMVPAFPASMQKDRPVDATLLRPEPASGDAATFGDQPLFALDSAAGHINTDRNPYFRHEGFQKIGSVLSAHSNVFAVWMTVGYFEVEENKDSAGNLVIDAAHPEGYSLGQEIGADSGEVVRHRSFYIIDRSVPVGFLPGQKLNTDDCILLRRFIE